MKILFLGAGVIGCVYALKLFESGYDVTVLARGERSKILKNSGLQIRNILTNENSTFEVPVIDRLTEDAHYDWMIVTVRLDQLKGTIPIIRQNKNIKSVLFMLNYPDHPDHLADKLPEKKILLGFPGIGGTYRDGHIEYIQIKQQKTTLGNIDGSVDNKTSELKMMFQKAGFNLAISKNIQAWLKTHAVFISCVSAAIVHENGSSVQLGKNRHGVRKMVKAIREGFKALESLEVPVIPDNIKTIFLIMPVWFSVIYWRKALRGKTGTLAIAPHANAAKNEMQVVAGKVLQMAYESSVKTPILYELLSEFILLK